MKEKAWEHTAKEIFHLEHEYFCVLWQLVKKGELEVLEGRRKRLGLLMLEHSKYQYFWEIPSAFAADEISSAVEREGVNPDLHLAVEAAVQEQIENGDPPETDKAYRALLEAGIEPHEARHTVGRILMEVIWETEHMAVAGQEPDVDIYIRKLKHLAKHPLQVRDEQIRKLEENL